MKENAPIRQIYIVPHSHHDYAWVHERQWHILRYCEIFNRVIDWLEKNPTAYWMIDNVAHSWEPFAQYYPERAEQFKKLVQEGRIEVSNGGYSLARPSYVGEESFVRNLIAGDTYFKETFGLDEIPYYHNLDTASGQQQMPQLLKLMGCRWYRFQRPEVTLDQRGIPRTFYWQGLDGTKILVSRAFGGGMLDASYTNLDFETQWEEAKERFLAEDITPRRVEGLCPSDTEMIHFGCDDSFPDTNWYDREVHLFEFIDAWNAREESKIGLSTARKYFEDLEKKELETFACGLDDSELTFNLPAKGDRSMWRKRGELDQLLTQTEGLGVIAALSGDAYPEAELEKMWMQSFQITGHAIDFIHKQDDDALMDVAINAQTSARILSNQLKDAILSKITYSPDLLGAVINTQPFARKETVRLCVTTPHGVPSFELVDGAGNLLPYQIVRRNSHLQTPAEVRRADFNSVDVLVQPEIPAFGWNTIHLKSTGENSPIKVVEAQLINNEQSDLLCDSELLLSNGKLDLLFREGKLIRLTRLADNKTISAEEGQSLFQMRFVRTGEYKNWMFQGQELGEEKFIPQSWHLVENGPIRWVYRIKGSFCDGQKAECDLILNQNAAHLEFSLTLITTPENGYYTADIACGDDPTSVADVFFGAEPRDVRDIRINGGEVYLDGQIYGRNFVNFKKDDLSLSLVSGDCSVYYLHRPEKGYISLFLTRNCLLAHSDEYWNRNLPDAFALEGKNHFHFALLLPDEAAPVRDSAQFTRRYHQPLIYHPKYNRSGSLPTKNSYLDFGEDSAIVTASYIKNGDLFLRFFETEGKPSDWSLCTGFSYGNVASVDFLNQPVTDGITLTQNDNTLSCHAEPFKIVTLQIRPESNK